MTKRLGPMAGLVGGLGTLVGFALSDIAGIEVVNPSASADTVANAVIDNTETLQLGTSILLVGLFFLIWFLTYLPHRLETTGAGHWPAMTAGAAGLIAASLMALVVAYVRAVTHTSIAGEDALIVKGVVYYDWDYLRTLSPFVSASLAGIGIAGLVCGSLPRPVSWLLLILAVLPLALPPGFAVALYFLVLAGLAVFLVVRPEAPRHASP